MKNFLLIFGSGDPSGNSGLTPTFTVFKTTPGGTNATPPGITQVPTNTGLFYFTYGPTNSISFVVDGGSALSTSTRYISGLLDPIDAVDEQVTEVLTRIGTTASSFGSTSIDPGDLYGYLKRLQELQEGDATFNKSTSTWDIYSRGASTLLREKTFDNTSGEISKA